MHVVSFGPRTPHPQAQLAENQQALLATEAELEQFQQKCFQLQDDKAQVEQALEDCRQVRARPGWGPRPRQLSCGTGASATATSPWSATA